MVGYASPGPDHRLSLNRPGGYPRQNARTVCLFCFFCSFLSFLLFCFVLFLLFPATGAYNRGHSEPPLNTRMLKVIAMFSRRSSMAMVVGGGPEAAHAAATGTLPKPLVE